VYYEYEKRLRSANALDFGDLIYRLVRSMHRDEQLLTELQNRYDHVLVDEFQDTNQVQFRLVHDLCSQHRNLTVVGDDDQSIYRWRGADRRNILDFQRHFADASMVKLEQNYRCTKRILHAANSVVANNEDREPKTLWTENQQGHAVTVVSCDDERFEAQAFVALVLELMEQGSSRSEIALLYRTHAQSRAFEEALRAANLSYRVYGGIRYYDRAEVKDVLAYLRVIHNPDDDVSLLRIINTPARGIGKTTINRLMDAAVKQGCAVWQVVGQASEHKEHGKAARTKLRAFYAFIESLQQMVAEQEPVSEICKAILEQTGYIEQLTVQDTAEADAKIENLKELVSSVVTFERDAESTSLSDYLELVTLQTDMDRAADEDAVTLMTIHAAKGLEFPVVAVAGLEEGTFPHRSAEGSFSEDEEGIEEERRLAYVAFTRARQRLVLSHAKSRRIYGDLRFCFRSRFVDELPAEQIQWVKLGNDSYEGVAKSGNPQSDGGVNRYQRPSRKSASKELYPGDSFVDRSEVSDMQDCILVSGSRVRHSKFGVGQVRDVTPGSPTRASVYFAGIGLKTILTDFLEPL
jgi:DNA helicase-2/ATP-dependent DNA helicase PcrA